VVLPIEYVKVPKVSHIFWVSFPAAIKNKVLGYLSFISETAWLANCINLLILSISIWLLTFSHSKPKDIFISTGPLKASINDSITLKSWKMSSDKPSKASAAPLARPADFPAAIEATCAPWLARAFEPLG